MNKWLLSSVASLALLVTACANTAAPDHRTNDFRTASYSGSYNGMDGINTQSSYPRGNGYDIANRNAMNRGSMISGSGINTTYPRGFTTTQNYGGGNRPGFDTGITRDIDPFGTGYGTARNQRAGMYGPGIPNTMNGRAGIYQHPGVNNDSVGFSTTPGYNNLRVFQGANPYSYRPNGSVYKTYGINNANTTNRAGIRSNMGVTSRIGFVQVERNMLLSNPDQMANSYVDREALAQSVGNVSASVPGVNTATVLVTDREILVGITPAGGDVKATKAKVRMNAMSVSPRWYKVYVTENQQTINQLKQFSADIRRGMGTAEENQRINQLVQSISGKTAQTKTSQQAKTAKQTRTTSPTKSTG